MIDVTGLTTLKASELRDGMVVTWGTKHEWATVIKGCFVFQDSEEIESSYDYYLNPEVEHRQQFESRLNDILD